MLQEEESDSSKTSIQAGRILIAGIREAIMAVIRVTRFGSRMRGPRSGWRSEFELRDYLETGAIIVQARHILLPSTLDHRRVSSCPALTTSFASPMLLQAT